MHAPTQPLPTGEDVAAYLSLGDDPTAVAQAEVHAGVVAALAAGYTRDVGFDHDLTTPDLAAVITTAAARMLSNPEQVDSTVGSVNVRGGFQGWSLAELIVLNRYRRRAL